MIQELKNYLFLHRELIKVYNSAFCGYSQEYFFVPPNSYMTDRFDGLLREYLSIEQSKDRKMFDWIDQLPLVSLRAFRSLADQFDESIRLWNNLKSSIQEDLEYIDKHLLNDLEIPDNLRVISFELKEAIEYHEQRKQDAIKKIGLNITKTGIMIDAERSLLIVGDKSYPIQITNKPYIFLKLLLSKPGIVIKYTELAKEMQLNAYHDFVTDENIKREVHDVKRELMLSLKKIKVPKTNIDNISTAIESVKQLGYKLNLISL